MSTPNVLLVVLDSVRAANAGICGYSRDTTPFLQQLGSTATVFSEARAGGKWSLPSHASLFTGLHVEEHELYDTDRRIEPGHTVFADLSQRGYSTAVFSSNDYITGDVPTGLEADFDVAQGRLDPPFSDALDPMEYEGSTREFIRESLGHKPIRSILNGALVKLGWDFPQLVPDRMLRHTSAGYARDEVYAQLFLDWMDDQTGPWAACLNLMGAHHPYRPNEDDPWFSEDARRRQDAIETWWEFYGGTTPWSDLEALIDLYDCTIRNADALVEEVVDALRSAGEYENTLLVITADHGDGFGEHSHLYPDVRLAGHKVGIHESLLHVPLVVKYPHQETGKRVTQLASLTNFPDAVWAAIEGNTKPGEAFAVDDFALASDHGILALDRDAATAQCEESLLEILDRPVRVVYEQRDGTVVKELSGPRHSVRIDLNDGTVTDSDGSLVSSAYADRSSAGVVAYDEAELSDPTRAHLEEMGYL
jgi:arylsulfatase